MKSEDRRELERELEAQYASSREAMREMSEAEREDRLLVCVQACERELDKAEGARGDRALVLGFARAQLRFVTPATWAAFACLAAAVMVGMRVANGAFVPELSSAAGALLACACVANVTRARAFGMAELEGSCRFNAVSVVLARMVMMGIASAIVFAAAGCSSAARETHMAGALMWMGAPYLVSCAGGLMCARRVASVDARGAAMVWSAGVVGVAAMLNQVAPRAYLATSAWVWALACLCAAVVLALEVRAWVAASACGFAERRCAAGA